MYGAGIFDADLAGLEGLAQAAQAAGGPETAPEAGGEAAVDGAAGARVNAESPLMKKSGCSRPEASSLPSSEAACAIESCVVDAWLMSYDRKRRW